MGYDGPYSLGTRCASEFLGLMLVIFLGESAVANAELPRTKGHGMSYGWVSAGFGTAFGISLAIFSRISAHINPATLLALWALGDLSAGDVFALGAAEFAGAFAGAVLVWLHFLPHFRTLPMPQIAGHQSTTLLEPGDVQSSTSRLIASYNAQLKPKTEGKGAKAALLDSLGDLRFYTRSGLAEQRRNEVELGALGPHSIADVEGGLRRRSIQVADAHKRMESSQADLHDLRDDLVRLGRAESICLGEMAVGRPPSPRQKKAVEVLKAAAAAAERGFNRTVANGHPAPHHSSPPNPMSEAQLQEELMKSAIRLDQAVKLSVFATRPAVRAPLLNFIVEFLGTTALISCSELLGLQSALLSEELQVLWRPFDAAFVGFLVFLLVLGIGGPTGIAMNPARDIGPRFAHWLLPIPGKGSSEWSYSPVPLLGGLLGGLAGGGLLAAIREMYIKVPIAG